MKDETGKALRSDAGKIAFHLIPIPFLIEWGKVYTGGAMKYYAENWRKGMKYSRVFRCIMSHLFRWLCGEKFDKELGTHHLVMVAWNAAALYMYEMHYDFKQLDDRQDAGFDLPNEFFEYHPTQEVLDAQQAKIDGAQVKLDADAAIEGLKKIVNSTTGGGGGGTGIQPQRPWKKPPSDMIDEEVRSV